MRYIVDDWKLLALVAGSGLIVFIVWLVMEKGNQIALIGMSEPEEITHSAIHQTEQIPELQESLRKLAEENKAAGSRPTSSRKSGDVYKWVDENGTISFSDRPINTGAERISVQPAPSYNFPQNTQTYRPQATPKQVASTSQNRTAKVQAVSSTWNPQTARIARGTFMTAGGHRITASASHFGTELSFEGRVSGGERCQSLELTGFLQSNQGNRYQIRAVAENVGGPSRLFESRKLRVSSLKRGWELFRIDAICIGN